MESSITKQESTRSVLIILIILILVKLLIHLFTNAFASYGIFRDEFYYLACSHRLDLGYVDQPPLSIYILACSRVLFRNSLFALRLLPAFAGALTVLITGLMVRKLGGGMLAVAIACLAVIAAPIYLGMNTVYSMNCFDILLWTLGAYILILIVKENKPMHWIVLGLVIGLGLLNKIGMIWFATGLFIAMLLTNQRKHFLRRWPYLAALVALGIFLPYIIWNFTHDFAHLEFIRNATRGKYAALSPIDFIFGQFMILQPVTLPVWLAGLYYFFFSKEGKSFRMLGIIYVAAFLILVINAHSKPEYLSPAYSMMFAAGAVHIERISQRKYWVWLKYTIPILIVIGGLFTAPITLPFLPVETYIQYSKRIGIAPGSYEAKELGELHQFYADMFGWENMAETVSQVFVSLPLEEKTRTVIFGRNYGEAGAIEYYSRKYDLPAVISSHNNYWIWGHGTEDYQTIIFIGGAQEDHLDSFEEVEQAAIIRCAYCMPYENNLPVYICRKPKRPLEEIWNSIKHYE
ncbi:MAG: glycosyltransferase family 39 protein [Planctomycetes bacterium]|nr:glycosyltransferase family 39 protein [Planctomycetota bacterium]